MSATEKRLLFVWLGLSLISLMQLWLSSAGDGGAPVANITVTTLVIGMATIKVRFIVREFMEVRHAPVLLGRLTDAWLLLTTSLLLGIYYVGVLVG